MSYFGYGYGYGYDFGGVQRRETNRHLGKLTESAERLAREAKEPTRTLVAVECPKCPSDQTKVTFQHRYNRAAESRRWTHETEQLEREIQQRADAKAAREAWLELPKRKRKKTPEPWEYVFSTRLSTWRPSDRWFLGEHWDAEHLLNECAACGFSWRQAID